MWSAIVIRFFVVRPPINELDVLNMLTGITFQFRNASRLACGYAFRSVTAMTASSIASFGLLGIVIFSSTLLSLSRIRRFAFDDFQSDLVETSGADRAKQTDHDERVTTRRWNVKFTFDFFPILVTHKGSQPVVADPIAIAIEELDDEKGLLVPILAYLHVFARGVSAES